MCLFNDSGADSQATNHHSLYDYEDKHAEDYVLTARKHLFLINNLYSLLSFVKERRKDLSGAANSASSSSGEKVSLLTCVVV